MMYPYMTLADETEIVHSHLIEENGQKKVIVNFERPTEEGFDSARCELPNYTWLYKEGYSDQEITMFEELLKKNVHLLFKRAEMGEDSNKGIDILRLLDRGLDDMEEKRELPVDEAFEMITKLRLERRNV